MEEIEKEVKKLKDAIKVLKSIDDVGINQLSSITTLLSVIATRIEENIKIEKNKR